MNPTPAPIPEGLDLLTDYQGLVIRRKWFSHIVWFLLIFCVAWDSFLVFWYSGLSHSGSKGPDSMFDLFFYLFPIGHVAVGVGLTYYCVCLLLNTTDLIARPEALQVATYPLPWPGSKIIRREKLSGFLVRERWTNNNEHNRPSVTFKVSYVDATNHEQTLLSSISNREQAEYICTTLSHYYQLSVS